MRYITGKTGKMFEVKNCSFTMVELMVVISIIVVLASLMFPALNKARESVKAISCVNNQRQCGLAITSYIGDYDGYFLNEVAPGKWTDLYTNSPQSTFKNILFINKYLPDGNNVVGCPASPAYNMCAQSNYSSLNSIYVSYGFRWNGFSKAEDHSSFTAGYMVYAKRIKKPSSFFLFADSLMYDTASGKFIQIYQVTNTTAAMRHNNKANFLFLDGHVEKLSPNGFADNLAKYRGSSYAPLSVYIKDVLTQIR
jgi:prepilin-type processing-associated H-X9-DG protein